MTFGAILADFYYRMKYPPSPAATVVAAAKVLANDSHRELLRLPGMSKLRDDTLAITATAAQPRTALPGAVARIRGPIVDRANFRRVLPTTLSELRVRNPSQTFSGPPEWYAPAGYSAVALQPSNASELFVKSDSASDTGTAYLEGIRSDGSLVSKSVAMTGITAVSFSAAETGIVEVTKFYLSTAAVGNVTLREDSGIGTELARIAIGRVFSRYLLIEWDPIPATTATLYADITRSVPDLVVATDEPLLPEDFHDLIGLRMRMKAYEGLDDTRADSLKPEWDKGVSALRSWVLNDGDTVASLRPVREQWSSLGANYPAGS